MTRRELPAVVGIGVGSSLIAAAIGSGSKSLWHHGVGWPVAVGIAASAVATLVLFVVRRQFVRMSSYMTRERLESRIQRAAHEIWSFQISGGDFTRSSVELYQQWLNGDSTRVLKLMFADPEKKGLIKSLVRLGGMGEVSQDNPEAIRHLQETIRATVDTYTTLAAGYPPGRVLIHLYDCCPPCSIHAVDPSAGGLTASIFVEHYLPGLAWAERPCIMLRPGHRSFRLYHRQCEEWFDSARPVPPIADPMGDMLAT